MKPYRELRPVAERPADYERITRLIIEVFRREVYLPLAKILKVKSAAVVSNATVDSRFRALTEALRSGKVRYEGGRFVGSFNAQTSKAIRAAGGVWDKSAKGYALPDVRLTAELRQAVLASEARFRESMASVDESLRKILPAEIAERVKISDVVGDILWKTDRNIGSTLKGISVSPELTPERRKRIADEWQDNLRLEIKDFTQKEIASLREKIQANAFKGNRYDAIIGDIQKSFGVTAGKAKFLASQETRLLVSKFKETRYNEAGIDEYVWRCVVGSPLHPVRPSHKALEGKTFRFSDPPITTAPGEPVRRCNPGEDFGCRCNSIPIVRF